MIQACSKRAMSGWYRLTAIQYIRPVKIDMLSSQMFWLKCNQVAEQHIQKIVTEFFRHISRLAPSSSDCVMFDTTNYYTFMATDTDAKLAQRDKNKEGRNWLRQIGVALLVSRDKRVPLYYREYEGNRHDSKVFMQIMDDMFEAMHSSAGEGKELTIVFDKGMNSQDTITAVDAREDVHY